MYFQNTNFLLPTQDYLRERTGCGEQDQRQRLSVYPNIVLILRATGLYQDLYSQSYIYYIDFRLVYNIEWEQ